MGTDAPCNVRGRVGSNGDIGRVGTSLRKIVALLSALPQKVTAFL